MEPKLARGINLSDTEVAALNALATIHKTCSRSGPTTGEPSWRVLIMAIAAGDIRLTPCPKSAFRRANYQPR